MLRKPLLLALLLAGCSKGPEADLVAIGEARSLAAEWALINEQDAQGKLTDSYSRTMRQSVREQLQTTASSLTQSDSRYGEEIRALLAQPDDAAPNQLRSHAERLRKIEDSLESA
jgi:FtsZ-binding cell division protein ZapB